MPEDALDLLRDPFRSAVRVLIWRCEREGVHVVLYETARSIERQRELIEAGASWLKDPAKGKHVQRVAADFILDRHKVPVRRREWNGRMVLDAWDYETPEAVETWLRFGAIAESIGLIWGGRWGTKNPETGLGKDPPHVELPD